MNFSCVRVRLPLNGELYGYDVEIPDGHQIDANKTVITVSWYKYIQKQLRTCWKQEFIDVILNLQNDLIKIKPLYPLPAIGLYSVLCILTEKYMHISSLYQKKCQTFLKIEKKYTNVYTNVYNKRHVFLFKLVYIQYFL